jgi:hypothetical protein
MFAAAAAAAYAAMCDSVVLAPSELPFSTTLNPAADSFRKRAAHADGVWEIAHCSYTPCGGRVAAAAAGGGS